MARPIRVEFAGAAYHVTARGNEQRPIFRDDTDRRMWLATVGQACERFGLVVHAYCLMPNHYHLLAQTPRGNLSAAAGWLQTTYTIRFNRRHSRSGHLFQGRYKAHLVDEDTYAAALIVYVHLNPVRPRDRHRPVPADRKSALRRYRWSSDGAYAGRVIGRAVEPWLCMDWLSYFGRTRSAAHRNYRERIDSMFGEPVASPFAGLRGGLVLGGEALWDKARGLIERAADSGDEEVRWRRRVDFESLHEWIEKQVAGEADRKMQIWLRVRLGGQRQTDVAKACGFSDGSGVHQVVRRLEKQAERERNLAKRMAEYRARLSSVKS